MKTDEIYAMYAEIELRETDALMLGIDIKELRSKYTGAVQIIPYSKYIMAVCEYFAMTGSFPEVLK
jgi:hypothetical protein